MIDRAAVIGLGEVGLILVEDLLASTDVQISVWDYQFANPNSRASRNLKTLESSSRVTVIDDAALAAKNSQLVLSAVTADQAVSAATSILPGLGRDAFFVDINSVSPGTKIELAGLVERVGGRFVEASVMSPILPARSGSPVILSGRHALEMEKLGPLLGFSNMRTVSEELGVAAATKMCRSVIVKGMEALVTESLLAARHYGVESAVVSSLDNLFPGPDWPVHARYLIARTLQHGERRASEMVEAGKTVEEAGYSAWMSNGTVMRQAWAPQFASALAEESLEGMLDDIRHQFTNME